MPSEHDHDGMVELWRLYSSTWKAWYRRAEENLSELSLSIPEYRLLTHLVDWGPTPMAKLASESSVSQGWITSMVDRMEEEGLVQRVRDRDDRRVIRIAILPHGVRTVKKAREMHLEFVRKSFENFTDSEKKEFTRLLIKLSRNLSRKGLTMETE